MSEPSQESSKELLPCPFCGGTNVKAVQDIRHGEWYVICPTVGGCCISTGHSPSKETVIAAWNRRAAHEPSARKPIEDDGHDYRSGVFTNTGYVGTACGYIVRDGTWWVATFRNEDEADRYVKWRNETRPIELCHAEPPCSWQPIETAPKDGTPILVANDERDGAWIAYYCPVYVSGYRPDDPWSSLMLNMRWHKNPYASTVPTKWMPIPVPTKNSGPTLEDFAKHLASDKPRGVIVDDVDMNTPGE